MKQHPILFSTPMVQAILEGNKTMTRRISKRQPTFKVWEIIPPGKDVLENHKWVKSDYYRFSDCAMQCPTVADVKFPYGKVGDIIWVREMHYSFGHWEKTGGLTKNGWEKWGFVPDTDEVFYFDNMPHSFRKSRNTGHSRQSQWYKRNSLFMPKESCRLFLKITDIKVERLKGLTEQDAIKEGGIFTDNGIHDSWPKHITKEQAKPVGGLKAGWSHTGETHPDKCLRSAVTSFGNLWEKINGAGSWDANPFVWAISFERIEKPL